MGSGMSDLRLKETQGYGSGPGIGAQPRPCPLDSEVEVVTVETCPVSSRFLKAWKLNGSRGYRPWRQGSGTRNIWAAVPAP